MLKLSTIKEGDWSSVRQAIQKITIELGNLSSPTFDSLTFTSPLTVANGGTGVATLTDGGILLGSGTGTITPLAQATNGQIPIGSTGADPVLAGITGTANQITVTNGAGTITLSLPATINVTTAVQINGTQVLGTQQAHIANATTQDIAGADTVDETKLESDLSGIVSTINSILTALEAHGIVASS